MSYEATYSSKINTRPGRILSGTISNGVFSLASKMRSGADEGIRVMNSFMNQKVEFPCSIKEIKADAKNCINQTDLSGQASVELNFRVLSQNKVLSRFINPQVINEFNIEAAGIKSQVQISEKLIKKTVEQAEKTFVDITTVLAVQAITNCGWKFIDSNTELTSQTLVARNNQGTVLAVYIEPENMSIDVAGMCDSSCKTNVEKILNELDKLGLKTKVDSQNEHRRRGGGTLLTYGQNAKSIKKACEQKKSIKIRKNISFQTNNESVKTAFTNNNSKEKKRESL